jgi:hypothetical protein
VCEAFDLAEKAGDGRATGTGALVEKAAPLRNAVSVIQIGFAFEIGFALLLE